MGRPWYRQFWPWVLIGIPALSVAMGVATFVVAVRHADTLVRDDWYRRGLAVNRDLARAEEAARLGVAAALIVGPPAGGIVVVLEGAAPVEIDLELQHPTDARRDHAYRLVRAADGAYRAPLDRPIDGRWYATLAAPSESWRLAAPLTLAIGARVQVAPGG